MEQGEYRIIDTSGDRAIICPLERGAGIYKAINKVMKNITAISKDKRNTQQSFNYRGIDDVMNVLKPLLDDAGVFIVPEVLESSREERTTKSGSNIIYTLLKMRYWFFAEDGSFVTAVVQGEGMDLADKSANKAEAIAMKYACFQVFCIPTEEMAQSDPDGHSPEGSTASTASAAINSTPNFKSPPKSPPASKEPAHPSSPPPAKATSGSKAPPASPAKEKASNEHGAGVVSKAQLSRLWAIINTKENGHDALREIIEQYGFEHTSLITKDVYDEICERVEALKTISE